MPEQEFYKSIYSGQQLDASLGRIINGELDEAVSAADEAADRAQSAADAIQEAIDNLPPGAVPVIDDLTTGGSTVALSAEQGKVLKGMTDSAQTIANTALESLADHEGDTNNPHAVTAQQIGAIPTSSKGIPGGVAPLDANGHVPANHLLLPGKNLLPNAWFEERYVYNQRGNTSAPTGTYLVDRWKQYSTGTPYLTPEGVVLPPGTIDFGTQIEISRVSIGTPYTCSVLHGGQISTATVAFTGEENQGVYLTDNGVTFLISYNWAGSGTVLVCFQNHTADDITMPRAKLELGPVSTLHLDTPPTPAEQELNRQVCKRYYQRIGIGMLGRWGGAAAFSIYSVLPVEMRITPTISLTETSATLYRVGLEGFVATGLSILSVETASPKGIGVAIQKTSGGSPIAGEFAAIASDVIALSADL